MRNYWLKIVLGALGIFVLGMIGVSLVRGVHTKIHDVVEGDGPITIPLGLIPFVLAGERLGKLDQVTLHRESPSRVSAIELEVNLTDSLLAQGLAGCRLAANFEGESNDRGVKVRVNRDHNGAFHCVPGDSTPPDLLEYGVAIFRPGDVEVPLLLPADLVTELQSLEFVHDSLRASGSDSAPQIRVPNADSIKAEVARQLEGVDSVRALAHRFRDSVRAEALKRIAEQTESQ
jgi:hypothetical protein